MDVIEKESSGSISSENMKKAKSLASNLCR